jgi:peroxiredoxin
MSMNPIRISLLSLLMLVLLSGGLAGQGYRISVSVPDLPDKDIILAHRMGLKFFTDDTVRTDDRGLAVFEGTESLPEGMYQVVFPDKKYSEFFLDREQVFGLSTRASAPSDSLTFTGSPVNARFLEWQQATAANRNRTSRIQATLKTKKLSPDSIGLLNKELQQLQGSASRVWDSAVSDLGGTLAGSFIRGLRPVRVPESLSGDNTQDGQMKQYRYVRSHFFDGIDFHDERLLRTPLIETKLDQYFRQVIPQVPDTIIAEVGHVIGLTRPGGKVHQFVVQYLFNKYSEPEIMGTDAVYVHIAENYYFTGQAHWVDSTNLQGIRSRVKELKPLLIGAVAPPIDGLTDTLQQPYDLKKIRSDYLILYFWSPDCGFCKESTPKLYQQYPDLKQLGAEVVALNTRTDKAAWVKFINEHKLGWINLYSPARLQDMMENYQAFSTPALYILDSERRIIAKSISVDQVKPFLTHHSSNRKSGN